LSINSNEVMTKSETIPRAHFGRGLIALIPPQGAL
jgi:hypothetical protein